MPESTEPQPNPHVDRNNAKEEARQEKQCTQLCPPGLPHPDCEKHGLGWSKLGSTTAPVWDGPEIPLVKAEAVGPVLTHTVERYATLKRLVHAFLADFAARNPRSWNHANIYPEVHALIKFIDFKP